MSCGRVRRELLERFRFGRTDECSAAHLDHLVGCPGCRDEIGIDQALARQLRRALQARVAGRTASADAFVQIRRRALLEENAAPTRWPRLIGWRSSLRTLVAGSAMALIALVSSGQLSDLARTADAPPPPWQGVVQSASIPVLQPWDMHPYRALGIPPPERPSGLTPQADAVGVVAVIPSQPNPTTAGFFR